jgi:large conductance mechanosensitive channel
MLKEFKEFAMRGSVIDMAVGIIIGAAFGAIAKSLVTDVIMPPIGLLLGRVDFANLFFVLKAGQKPGPYSTIVEAQNAGAVTLNYGMFINTIVNFIIVSFVIFLVIKNINRLKKEIPKKPTTKECPYCFSTISINAKRCAFCTSSLETKKS